LLSFDRPADTDSAPTMPFIQPRFDFAPYRLSGVVYGALLNHRPQLAALGEAVHALPYQAPPRWQ
jgi:hypothetical protein